MAGQRDAIYKAAVQHHFIPLYIDTEGRNKWCCMMTDPTREDLLLFETRRGTVDGVCQEIARIRSNFPEGPLSTYTGSHLADKRRIEDMFRRIEGLGKEAPEAEEAPQVTNPPPVTNLSLEAYDREEVYQEGYDEGFIEGLRKTNDFLKPEEVENRSGAELSEHPVAGPIYRLGHSDGTRESEERTTAVITTITGRLRVQVATLSQRLANTQTCLDIIRMNALTEANERKAAPDALSITEGAFSQADELVDKIVQEELSRTGLDVLAVASNMSPEDTEWPEEEEEEDVSA